MKDGEVRELYFLTPFRIMPAASQGVSSPTFQPYGTGNPNQNFEPRVHQEQPEYGGRPGPYGKGKGKEKGKGKGKEKCKGKGKGQHEHLTAKTLDGREICFNYNNLSQSCNGSCNRLHVCRIQGCFKRHPMYEHETPAPGSRVGGSLDDAIAGVAANHD